MSKPDTTPAALRRAELDAHFYGAGYLMVLPDGRWVNLPPEAVSINRDVLLKAREAINDVPA